MNTRIIRRHLIVLVGAAQNKKDRESRDLRRERGGRRKEQRVNCFQQPSYSNDMDSSTSDLLIFTQKQLRL